MTRTPEERDDWKRGSPPDREARRLSAVEQLNRHPRLVLLGEPGSGKSTFVKFAALCLSGEALGKVQAGLDVMRAPLESAEDEQQERAPQPWDHGPLLPVCVVLRDFAARGLPAKGAKGTAKHLWRFIAAELKAASLGDYAPCLRAELLDKGGLLFLDGLDEVPDADSRRDQIKQTVEAFATTFAKCRVLVTSRTYAYQKQAWRLGGFAETVLAPFEEPQIRGFVDRWYAHTTVIRGRRPDDAQGRAELLKRAIFGSERLRELAERPLLLTLMASLHAWRGGSLPEKREELYADAMDLLLNWWERPKITRDAKGEVIIQQPSLTEWLKVPRDEVLVLLGKLAFQSHAEQKDAVGTADLPEEALVSGLIRLAKNPEVNPVQLVRYLSDRAGLLLPRGIGVYTFPHRTFQEYLAACHLTNNGYPNEVARLARTDPNRWREVAMLAGAKAGRGAGFAVWSLVEALCPNGPGHPAHTKADTWGAGLAGRLLVETIETKSLSEADERKLQTVKAGLAALVEGDELPPTERARAGDYLAKLGDPREGVTTLDDMRFCFVQEGPFRMGSDKACDEMAEDDEQPEHEVVLAPFFMARYPVTVAQFQEFVDQGGYGEAKYWLGAKAHGLWGDGRFEGRYDSEPRSAPFNPGDPFDIPNHPVVGVSWYEATAFCSWLEEKWQALGFLPKGWRLSLPSEAQWEKAARGGRDIPKSPVIRPASAAGFVLPDRNDQVLANPAPRRIYPWGDSFSAQKANIKDTGIGTSSTVGCFAGGAGPYGVRELSGNVWEWTRSSKQGYSYDPKTERDDPNVSPNEGRVLRGGAFLFESRFARCAVRVRDVPDLRLRYVGFRMVASPFRL